MPKFYNQSCALGRSSSHFSFSQLTLRAPTGTGIERVVVSPPFQTRRACPRSRHESIDEPPLCGSKHLKYLSGNLVFTPALVRFEVTPQVASPPQVARSFVWSVGW